MNSTDKRTSQPSFTNAETQPRIALFLRTLVAGGAERVMLNIACGIADQGVKVDLVLAEAEGAYLAQIPAHVRLVDLGASKPEQRQRIKLPTSFQSTTSLPKLVRYLQQERPTALLAATHYPNEIAILAKFLARVSTRLVVSEHTTLSIEAQRVEQVSARLIPLTARLLYPWADEIVTVSQGVANDLAQIAGLPLERMRVIYNPVVTPKLKEQAEAPLDHSWFNSGEPPVVLGIGRFVAQKDFATLLRAFAKVRQVRPARLMMLGSGREEKQLRALAQELGIEEDVAWMGFTNNPFAYMKRSAVFVLSSVWEGLPTVLIEALTVGIPVVSTNCESGPAEILDNGKYGELVPVGDIEAMAQAILKVLSGSSKSADSIWLEQFTLERAVQKYLDVLKIN